MKTPLVFIPGLGADPRLFHHQKRVFKNSLCPPWLIPNEREKLANYARRWARHLKLKPNCCLVGVSFGGMVAQEMARWIKPRAVILIGSCRSPASIPFALRAVGSLPTWPYIAKRLCGIFPIIGGYFLGAKTRAQRDLLIRMFLETPDHFTKWTVQAICGWKGFQGDGIRVYHIHGERDHMIPLRKVKPDEVIRGGGHLISLNHSREVNKFIRKHVR
jgi:pimeloyl-ACP methyl ester carboxylesterase